MLGLYKEQVLEIAQMPTEHSWIKTLMLLRYEEAEKAETRFYEWAVNQFGRDIAGMVVRMTPHLLEWKAIEMFKEKHPQYYRVIPEITSPDDAVEIMLMDNNGLLTKEEQNNLRENSKRRANAGSEYPAGIIQYLVRHKKS